MIAGRLYELAKERKMGREVPMWEEESAVRGEPRSLGASPAKSLFQCEAQTLARIERQRRRFRIAVNLDGFLAGVDHDAAILAFCKMLFDGSAQ